MGEPLADFSVKGVSSSSCLCHNTCLDPGCEHICACCKVDFEAEIDDGQGDSVVEEIGTAFAELIHVYDHDGPDPGEESDENDEPLLSLESDSADDLVDANPEAVISAALGSDDASESSGVLSDDGNSSIYGTPKLVSAIKGTRAKQGIVTKLSVSWAPDVYDPPVTSDSHTVKGHQRGSRNGRPKYKSSKSSSSGTNGNKKDKKHSRHSSSSGSNKKDRRHSYRSSSSSTISVRADASGYNYHKAYSSSSKSETLVTESSEASPLMPTGRATLPPSMPTGRATLPPSMPTGRATLPPLMPTEKAALAEAVPVLKTMEQSKCATSCSKEKPFALLSRQFSAARYKGMFSFWSQNQLAS